MEKKMSADEWIKTIRDNKTKLKWSAIPLDKKLFKPYQSKNSVVKVIDGSRNRIMKQLCERIKQRDDNVIILVQLLPINSNMFLNINYHEYVSDGRLKFYDLILSSKYGETLMNKHMITSTKKFHEYLEYHTRGQETK